MPLSHPSAEIASFRPPASFDDFVVERALGSGGMGHVYLGRDVALDRPVALKFIASVDPSPAARSRFLVEARSIARLSHPNVVSVYRVGEVEGRPYIAYEFVSGESLADLQKPMAWATALRLAVGVARGLDAAHRAGILHRDIKPGNAMVSERGEIKLLDFGLAKLAEGAPPSPAPVGDASIADAHGSTERVRFPPALLRGGETRGDRGLTRPGTLMGTPAYLAPELWLGEAASPRSDVFALGLVVYELLVGKLPHADLENEAMAFAVIDGTLPELRTTCPEVPASFAAIVDRCLRRDPAERFASATELAQALEEIQTVFLPASGVTAVQVEPQRYAVAQSLARLSSQMRTLTSKLYERTR
jgi:serine/threonine protein kinase